MSPAAAVDALRSATDPAAQGTTSPALPVTRVVLGDDMMRSDRGVVRLPVWRFTVEGASEAISWPAVAPDAAWVWNHVALWSGRAEQFVATDVRPTADGTLLSVVLLRPGTPCSDRPTYRHEPRVTETAAVVVIGMARVPVDVDVAPGTPCEAALGWIGDTHVIRLAARLGGRIVVDQNGAPLTVGLQG